MKNPPHLPAKSCSVPLHRRIDAMFRFGVIMLIAFVSGIAATLVTVAWIAPVYTPNTVVYSIDTGNRVDRDRASDPLFVRQQEKQIAHIYDARKKVDGQFYQNSGYVGPGVFLTSDGWLAVYAPSYTAGSERYWDIIDYKGSVYAPEEVVVDPLHHIVYVLIEGDGFFAGSFASQDDVQKAAFSWSVYEGGWQPALLGKDTKTNESAVYPIWKPRFARRITSDIMPGSVLLAEDGKFLGFAGRDGTVISSFFVELQYTTVFENRSVAYRAVPWEGYMISASIRDGLFKQMDGFYVTATRASVADTRVISGDLVIRIEGKSIDEETLAEAILAAPEEFSVTVLRDSEEIDILVRKERVRVF